MDIGSDNTVIETGLQNLPRMSPAAVFTSVPTPRKPGPVEVRLKPARDYLRILQLVDKLWKSLGWPSFGGTKHSASSCGHRLYHSIQRFRS
jgi:hypothetical protein